VKRATCSDLVPQCGTQNMDLNVYSNSMNEPLSDAGLRDPSRHYRESKKRGPQPNPGDIEIYVSRGGPFTAGN